MESSSEYESSQSENEDTGLNLTQVNEMVKEYEKELKKDRKKNANRNENIGEILIDPEMLAKIKISQNQLKKLKPKKPRSEKQIESAKRMLDIFHGVCFHLLFQRLLLQIQILLLLSSVYYMPVFP